VPFRALMLLPVVQPPSRSTGNDRDSGDSTTRRDAMTGIPGSIAERRSSPSANSRLPSGNRNYSQFLFRHPRMAEEFSARRARASSGSTLKCRNLLRPTMVDSVDRNLNSYLKGETGAKIRPLIRFERKVQTPIRPTYVGGIKSPGFPVKTVTGGIVAAVRIVDNTFTMRQYSKENWPRAFAKNCRAFGPVSRNRHYRFLLKLITFFGFNQRDFRNFLRVRDLYLRGSRKFRGAIIGLIASYPEDFRSFVSALPRKRRPVSPRHGGVAIPV
jgi:hypothetical protein